MKLTPRYTTPDIHIHHECDGGIIYIYVETTMCPLRMYRMRELNQSFWQTWKFVDFAVVELRVFVEMYSVPVNVAVFTVSATARILTSPIQTRRE